MLRDFRYFGLDSNVSFRVDSYSKDTLQMTQLLFLIVKEKKERIGEVEEEKKEKNKDFQNKISLRCAFLLRHCWQLKVRGND